MSNDQNHNSPRSSSKGDNAQGWRSRGYLPHFDASGIYQAITYRLADSLPGSAGVSPASPLLTDAQKRARRKRIERILDNGFASCLLREPEISKIVVNAWKHFDGQRYELAAYVVMPNHVHVLIKTYEGFPLAKVVHSWKSYTAHKINQHLRKGRRDACALGKIWQNEYYDRFIRDEAHFAQCVSYIHENPVKAGLCRSASEWPASSASPMGMSS